MHDLDCLGMTETKKININILVRIDADVIIIRGRLRSSHNEFSRWPDRYMGSLPSFLNQSRIFMEVK